MTYDPFICWRCWGEHDHLPSCPSLAPRSENPGPADEETLSEGRGEG